MKTRDKEIKFYRTKSGKLAYYFASSNKGLKNKTVVNKVIKREANNSNKFPSTENETARFVIKQKERHGKYSMDKDVPGDKNKKKEIKNSMKLYKKMGGNLHIRSTVQSEEDKELGVRNPDFRWKNKLWDEKDNDKSTRNAVKSSVRDGLDQIEQNPGGVILVPHKDMPTHKAIEYAGQRLAESGRKGDRVLVMVDGKIKAVIRKKKRKGA